MTGAVGFSAAMMLPAQAQTAQAGHIDYAAIGVELVALLAVAIVLESGLTTLFQWRLYREFFNGKAVKTVVMFAAGYLVVTQFGYDVFGRILAKITGPATAGSGTLSQIISAMILAGGSAGIFKLFTNLGLRAPIEQLTEQPKPAQNKAWVSVRIAGADAAKAARFNVHIAEIAKPEEADIANGPVAGVVGHRSFAERLKSLFFADPMRFPPYGGRTVDAGTAYAITVTWPVPPEDGDVQTAVRSVTVFRGSFADRAIVDLVANIDRENNDAG